MADAGSRTSQALRGDLEIPAAQRTVCGPVLKARVEAEDGFERVLDRPSVTKADFGSVGFGERTHVRRHPEVALGPFGSQP